MTETGKIDMEKMGTPIAVVIAGVFIAAAIYFGGGSAGTGGSDYSFNQGAQGGAQEAAKPVPKVTSADHIIGNPNAQIVIVEYTDLECPFCKRFHETMKQVMDKYGKDGKVAWVLRNFPLQQLHPNAPKLALAAECVADAGGNDAYWKFLDEVFIVAPLNTPFDFSKLDATVAKAGVNASAFQSCYTSEKFKAKIEKELNDAVASGGQGTPFNIMVLKNGKNIEIPGAQPFEFVDKLIQENL
ncbi:DsbA family protein [Patescibacteria group bacterium]|nr:DsbA family protein [Patescibacteria group bacterium]